MATQIPLKIVVNFLKLLFISTSFASCFELLYNGNFLNYFLQVKKVYRRFHLDRRITAPIDIYCLIFTSLRWTLGPFLMGWQNLAKLSLCLADQYSSTSMSIYDNDQYSCLLLLHLDINFDNIQMIIVTMMISLPLIMMMTMMMASELKCLIPPTPPPPGTAHPPPRASSAHYWWQHLLQDSLPPRAQRADSKPWYLQGPTGWQISNQNLNIRGPTILQCCQEFLHLLTDSRWLYFFHLHFN